MPVQRYEPAIAVLQPDCGIWFLCYLQNCLNTSDKLEREVGMTAMKMTTLQLIETTIPPTTVHQLALSSPEIVVATMHFLLLVVLVEQPNKWSCTCNIYLWLCRQPFEILSADCQRSIRLNWLGEGEAIKYLSIICD